MLVYNQNLDKSNQIICDKALTQTKTQKQEPDQNKTVVENKILPIVKEEKKQEVTYDFFKKYPFFLECKQSYKVWPNKNETAKKLLAETYYNYSKPADTDTHSLRIIRGVVVYFPIEKSEEYKLEFKWLYRSWIEMQKYEPTKWRTDLIVFIDYDKKVFEDKKFFLNRLNCSFAYKRSSDKDLPMCTLIEYKSLKLRALITDQSESYKKYKTLSKKEQYELFLKDLDFFNATNDDVDLAPFYWFLKDNLKSYGYLDSILMAFDGYNYFRKAGFNFLIRSDMDVFLTPLFAKWLPRHCNDFYVGRGGFSTDFNNNRLRRIANGLNLKYAGIWNLGSTWYSTPHQFRIVSYLTLFGMAYLSSEEFAQPEREGKVGTILWPDWHYGVLLLYGQSLALNHLIALNELNVIKLEEHIDFPSGNTESIFKMLHIHVFHGDDVFSKFAFKLGQYDNMSVSNENATLVKYYALKMALDGKRTSEENLYLEFIAGANKKN